MQGRFEERRTALHSFLIHSLHRRPRLMILRLKKNLNKATARLPLRNAGLVLKKT